jgi:hypothetical protein
MKKLTSKRLAAGIALVLFLALPVAAERGPRGKEPGERAFTRVIKIVKRVLGISTTSDLPTVPKP